jgi:hypothetical protein
LAEGVIPGQLVAALGGFWLITVNHLRIEWTLHPHYSYGWAVPLLCGALLWRSRHRDLAPRRQDKRSTSGSDRLTSQEVPRKGQAEKRRGSELAVASLRIGNRVLFHQPSAILIWLALLWLATRLVQTANPEWRLVSWALALEVVGLTLVCVYLAAGGERLKQLAFPIWLSAWSSAGIASRWSQGGGLTTIRGGALLDAKRGRASRSFASAARG